MLIVVHPLDTLVTNQYTFQLYHTRQTPHDTQTSTVAAHPQDTQHRPDTARPHRIRRVLLDTRSSWALRTRLEDSRRRCRRTLRLRRTPGLLVYKQCLLAMVVLLLDIVLLSHHTNEVHDMIHEDLYEHNNMNSIVHHQVDIVVIDHRKFLLNHNRLQMVDKQNLVHVWYLLDICYFDHRKLQENHKHHVVDDKYDLMCV
mmetsp:Transcript_6282/g.10799  ORF Transcript_6282/g.10799 Transcript_6282/m.10799 type:complete len:200 (+) Transcript_6282:471-1070(+)